MYKLPNTLSEDIAYFGTLIDDFKQGKTEPVKFKGNRVPMGIYEQRKDGTYMVRVRCTGGFISPEQLKQVALTAQYHNSTLLHITTRQEIQIHHISIEQVKTILPDLQAVELSSKGGGGNTVRNFLVDVNSGISTTEVFDVLPYAVDLTTRLIAEPDSFTLPRKLKIAFSTSETNADFALINDLGFIATIKDGKRGFKVYLGGSVASNPTLGWELFAFAPEEDLVNIAVAAKRFFNNHGNRKNKHKARIRYIFYKEGEEKTKELFFNYYNEIKENEDFVFKPGKLAFEYKIPTFDAVKLYSEEFVNWRKRNVSTQRQNGLYSTIVPFVNGNTDSESLLKIAEFATEFGNDVLRFTARQQLQLRNIPEKYLGNLYLLLKELHVSTELPAIINNIVSCTGADTCRLGICYSKGASLALRKKLAKSKLNLDEVSNLQINISGCPNSCAQQIWSDIGFQGRVGRNERMYAAYNVYAGAAKGVDPKLGAILGSVSARDLPQFTEDILADYIPVKSSYSSFRAYLDAVGTENIKALIEKYKEVPSFEEDKNYYYDWGSEELFSVANKGPAECSAGLFDMIDLDLKFIKQGFALLQTENDIHKINLILYDIVFSSSRMLLVTKGAEPKTTSEAFELFIEKFINEGLVSDSFKELVKTAQSNPNADFVIRKDEVIELAEIVIKLYEGMDDSLQFKNQPVKVIEIKPESAVGQTEDVLLKTRVKNFRGVACPMNFVKTKIELATLKSGDLLEVWLDDGQPIQNVPGSVRNEGHKVISTTQVEDYWKVLIKKN
ncbi:MAG: sulfurtransferase TusA family protein [Paludibacter sp.]|nr:sulfurtransferase TusA family protein [Paludibacter sp.]